LRKKTFISRKSIRKHWHDNQVCPGKLRETRCLESDKTARLKSFDWPLHRKTGVELTHIGRSLGPHIKVFNQCGNDETGTLRESQMSHLLQQKNQTVQDNQPVKCQ